MAIIVPRRIPHLQKPEGPVEIDWTNPLSKELDFVYLHNQGVARELVRDVTESYNSSLLPQVGSQGREIKHTGKQELSISPGQVGTGGVTWLSFAKPVPSDGRQALICRRDGNGVNHIEIRINSIGTGGTNDTTGAFTFSASDIGSNFASSTIGLFNGSRHHAFCGRRNNSGACRVFFDGVDVTNGATTDTNDLNSTAVLVLGGLNGSTSIQYTRERLLDIGWKRALTDEEIYSISRNPYQILKLRRRWVPVVIQGGAGATVTPDSATHGHIADNATLSQNHILIVSDAGHGHIAEQTILTQSHLLEIADSLHNHAADNAGLLQDHILVLDSSSHGHSADQATLIQSHLLSIADSLHSQSADNATLSQAHILATDSALHAHAVDSVALDQTHILAVADALHAHAADNASLTVAGALDIANSIHAHSADQIALTQLHILATANALHGHSADNVTLISGLTLDITDAIHGHTAGQVTLQQAHILAVINATHGHTAEQATLGVDLIIQPSSHAHTADIVSLDPVLALAIQDAIHAHQANNIALNQQHILVISDALHSHLAQHATISEGAFTISTFPARTITVVGKSRTITVVAGNRTINA